MQDWVSCRSFAARVTFRKKPTRKTSRTPGKQLAELTRRNLEKRTPALEPTQKALEGVVQMGDQLAKKSLTRDEALKDLANVAEKLREELRDVGSDPALKKLQQAARNPTGADSQTGAGLQKQMEALQKQLGTPTGNPEALGEFQEEPGKTEGIRQGHGRQELGRERRGKGKKFRNPCPRSRGRPSKWACRCRISMTPWKPWRRTRPICS